VTLGGRSVAEVLGGKMELSRLTPRDGVPEEHTMLSTGGWPQSSITPPGMTKQEAERCDIDEVESAMTDERFIREYVIANRPLIVRGGLREWQLKNGGSSSEGGTECSGSPNRERPEETREPQPGMEALLAQQAVMMTRMVQQMKDLDARVEVVE
ncbi:hypothetical protein CYMTET_35362, partial [Cymbomonas tetramitiformis]